MYAISLQKYIKNICEKFGLTQPEFQVLRQWRLIRCPGQPRLCQDYSWKCDYD